MEIIEDNATIQLYMQTNKKWGIFFSKQQYVFFIDEEKERISHFIGWKKILSEISPGANADDCLKQGKVGMINSTGVTNDGYPSSITIFLPPLDKLSANQLKFLKFIFEMMKDNIKPTPQVKQIITTLPGEFSLSELLEIIEKVKPMDDEDDIEEKIVGIPFKDLYPRNARNLFS